MIRFTAFHTRFSMPLLTALTPLLAIRLGMRLPLAQLALALVVHELAHLLAAKLCHVSISEIRLLPFGGSARMENPYGLRPSQLFAVAAAGPAANLICAVCFAALAQWGLWRTGDAAAHVHINLTLMLFNLLPALPLDGGRMFYAILQRPLGQTRALHIGVVMGRFLALLLTSSAIFGWYSGGRLNLSFLLAAVFILCSAHDERDALQRASLQTLEGIDAPIQPARLFQLDADATVSDALRLLRPKEASWFVISKNGKPDGLLDGRTLAEYIRKGGASDAAIGALAVLQLRIKHQLTR